MTTDSAEESFRTSAALGPDRNTVSRSPALYVFCFDFTDIPPFHTNSICSPSPSTRVENVWPGCNLRYAPAARFDPIAGLVKKPLFLLKSINFTAPGVITPFGGAAPGRDESRAPVYSAKSGGHWKLIMVVPVPVVIVPWICPEGTK